MEPLTRLAADTANIQWYTDMFSLTVSNTSSQLIASLRFSSTFFDAFHSLHTHHSRISLHGFFNTLIEGTRHFILSFTIRDHIPMAVFKFRNRDGPLTLFRELPLSHMEEEYIYQINYTTFVSIPSQEFGRIVTELHNGLVRVSLKDSQVMFFTDTKGIVLTKERGQCFIEGVAVGDKIEFLIPLHPLGFFLDLAYRSIRVWLYKTSNNHSTMIVPVGQHAQFMIYFP